VAAAWGSRSLHYNSLTGPLPTELGTLDALTYLCVRRPYPPRLDACTVTGLWAECGGLTHAPSPGCGLSVAAAWGSRSLHVNSLTGPLPTELGTMDALTQLCVRRPSREQTAFGGAR
jgi:hypothetical protein